MPGHSSAREAPHVCNSLHRPVGCGTLARMALEHAILVSLSERPASGLDLTRRFDRSIGFFWSATHQQIYRVLARMEADGWVRSTAVAQHGRPDKKVYDVAAAGRRELARLDRRGHPDGAVPQRAGREAPRRVVRRPRGRPRPRSPSTAPSTRPGSRTTSSSPPTTARPAALDGHDLDVTSCCAAASASSSSGSTG